MAQYQKVGNVTGNGNIVIQSVDSDIVIEGRPSLTLNPAFALASYIDDSINRTELNLLRAAQRSIPLVGREAELQSLREWLFQPTKSGLSHQISVRTLIGQAGTGKTRLAIELMESLRQDKTDTWQAGFAAHEELTRFQRLSNLSSWSWVRATLVVVDYAATSAAVLSKWFAEIAHHGSSDAPLRILLLERHADLNNGWYSTLQDGSFTSGPGIEALFHPLAPISIAPLDSVESRRAILTATLKAFRPRGDDPPPDVPPPGSDTNFDRQLQSGQWREPLHLMMAALTALDHGLANAFSFSRIDLAFHVAKRELARIEKFAPQPTVAVQVKFLKHLSACVTLGGTLSENQALTLIEEEARALHLRLPYGAAETLEILRAALPGKDTGITGVQPDMIGEALILLVLGSESGPAQTAAITRLSQVFRSSVIPPIIRTVQDFATPYEGHLDQSLRWLDVLSESDDFWFLVDLENSLPASSLILQNKSIKITAKLFKKLSDLVGQKRPIPSRDDRIPVFHSIAETLGKLGLNDEELAQGVFKSFELSRVGQKLVSKLNVVGRHEEALSAALQSVNFHNTLATNLPGLFRPSLASSLEELARTLQALERPGEGLPAIESALDFYRSAVAKKDDSYLPTLAEALTCYSSILQGMQRCPEALTATQEAVDILDRLNLDPSKDIRAVMAQTLIQHSNNLSSLNKPVEALAAATVASHLYKNLAHDNVDAYVTEMARALLNQGIKLLDLNRSEEAVSPIEKALELYRELNEIRPEMAVVELARAYRAKGSILKALGKPADAMSSVKTGIETLTSSFQKSPHRYAQLIASLGEDYVSIARESGQEIDMQLLGPILNFANSNQKAEFQPS